jgi:hypothetical protein
MTDTVHKCMKEVWEWKRRAEEATRGMDTAQLIEFYRLQTQEVEQRMGVQLKGRDASDNARFRGHQRQHSRPEARRYR